MTWMETNTRLAALREAEAAIDADPLNRLPWNVRLAEVFGDRDRLLTELRYRWNLRVEAQLDPELMESEYEELREQLMTRHAGLLNVLKRHYRDEGPCLRIDSERFAHAS